ncbi:MAG: deoxyribonuclease IV [Gemmatimonadetes bacterium]|nr:deoxyribonuclease IV [Gemmatimonadota bacterium]
MTRKRHVIGTHPVDNGGIDMAVRRSAGAGMSAVQIFTAIPKFYGDKSNIRADRVERFKRALSETAMRAADVVVHGAYVLNAATEDAEKWGRTAAALTKEMERSTTLGVGGVCFHPGAAPRPDGPEAAAERVARAMAQALEAVPGDTRLYVENSAGAGTTFGKNANEVGLILKALPKALRKRAGYGLDTCHLFVSGYDLAASRAELAKAIDEFEEAAGEPPAFFHLNDSVGAMGSNRDRHALIGEGEIGAEPFGWLLADPRSRGIPLLLETPQLNTDVADDDPTGDPYDVRMMALLTELGAEV